MRSRSSVIALALAAALGAWSCKDTPCEDACEDERDDCESEGARGDNPLPCDRQYDYCLGVCANRPPDEP